MGKYKNTFYHDKSCSLILDDSFKVLKRLKPGTVDVIFADPPYFLSNNGTTCKSGKNAKVNKGLWDENATLESKHAFNKEWIRLCKRVLKPDGTIWISGTLHNIYSVGMALEEEGFTIINNITWQKTNPPPNLACKCFTHSTETILWAKKNGVKKVYFNYPLMKELNNNKQMKDVWTGSTTKKSEKAFGKHPTQKPEYLLERIILASTKEGDLILDPFCGSGTTGVVAKRLNRKFVGIDNSEEYISLAAARIKNTSTQT